MFLPVGLIVLVSGLRGLEARENGFLRFYWFLKWERIESYEWEGERDHTLTLKVTRRLPGWRAVSWGIPPVHKDALDNLLVEHVSLR
ncbi:MAG: DUF5673 domain-containing protein [Acidobacteriota bacterium]